MVYLQVYVWRDNAIHAGGAVLLEIAHVPRARVKGHLKMHEGVKWM